VTPLLARSALVERLERVDAEGRGPAHINNPTVFAVFSDEQRVFRGLVTARAAGRFPHRIFADLVAVEAQVSVLGDESAEEAVHLLDASEAEALAVLDADGLFLGAVTRASVLDALLREERRLHDALRLDEARLRAVLRAMPDDVFVLDAAGHTDASPSRAPASSALDPLAAGRLDDVMSHESADAVRASIARSLTTDSVQSATVRTGEREHEFRVVRLDDAAVVCVARDVTETIQLKAQLVFADRMVAMGTLAAGVAHEINNPLAYVMANVALVRAAITSLPGVPRELLDAPNLLRDVEEGLTRIHSIVRDLGGFSKGDRAAAAPVDLRAVLRAAINIVMPHIRGRARLVTHLDVPGTVLAVEARLGQVFVNLLVNAAHAIPEGAPDTNVIEVRLYEEADEVHAVVSDSGHGLSVEARARLFEAFFTTKPSDQGTGLGLFISHNIIRELHGRILIEDGIAGGCAFHVVIPAAARVAHESPPPPKPVARAARGLRVLVVDDEPAILTLFPALLRPNTVTVASSGARAIELLRSDATFDLVICDLMMPGVSGMDVYREVSTLRPALCGRFIFMTGGTYTDASRAFLDDARAPVLEKPFDLEKLRGLVARTTLVA
jgi:signal transduction histidine kinase